MLYGGSPDGIGGDSTERIARRTSSATGHSAIERRKEDQEG